MKLPTTAQAKGIALGIVGSIAIALVLFNSRSDSSGCPAFTEGTVVVGEKVVEVAVATTPEEKARGLMGCTHLPAGAGMYFPFAEPTETAFWMKNMLISLDIVWIVDGRVVHIDASVPPADPQDEEPPLYLPPQPVTAVLEVPEGAAEELNISVGNQVAANFKE